ncbi:MAG: creatininase family protein [Deltaproteobacteria bacterium]|nr:creatininase family protein [Deltaproteobacteria bacterium]
MYRFDSSILLDQLTWKEIDAKLKKGWTTVAFGIGSIEQHGPHLPLLTDAYCGDTITHEVAKKLKKTFQAPTIRVGCSDAHMGFPATLSISKGTLQSLMRDYCKSLSAHGFKNIVLIPTHGGNFVPTIQLMPQLSVEFPHVNIIAYTDFDEIMNGFHQCLEKVGISKEAGGIHAGHIEASIMLYLYPECVRKDKMVKGSSNKLYTVEQVYSKGTKALSSNGVLGDPARANAKQGKLFFETNVNLAFKYIQKKLKP